MVCPFLTELRAGLDVDGNRPLDEKTQEMKSSQTSVENSEILLDGERNVIFESILRHFIIFKIGIVC